MKVFTARKTPELDDLVIEVIVESKGFQELKEFSAYDRGSLSAKTAELLIDNCDNLIRIRGFVTWSGICTNLNIVQFLYKASSARVPLTVDL
jgi:hypothetical protein